jgi:MoxR-like ATPase
MVERRPTRGDQPLEPVVSLQDVQAAIAASSQVTVQDDVLRYLVRVARSTRDDPGVRLGASPRATLALHRAVQAWAAMHGRDFATPDDVKRMAPPVLAHRLIVALEARLRGRDASALVASILESLPVPVETGG